MNHTPIRIVLVDDHEMVREGLRTFLSREDDMVIVGEAGTAVDALKLVKRLQPHLVLLDLLLPDTSGMDMCRKLLSVVPKPRILVLTGYAEDATVIAALQSGAHGYVLKDVRLDELLRAVRTVAGGRGYLDPRITQQTLNWVKSTSLLGDHSQGLARLSRQERLILPLLAEGKTNKEIAVQLNLSDKTIKNYLANIFTKIHVKRRSEAVAWFIKENRSAHTFDGPEPKGDS